MVKWLRMSGMVFRTVRHQYETRGQRTVSAQAIAAVSLSIALAVTGHQSVPKWAVILTLVISMFVVFCSPIGWATRETRGIWSLATDPRCFLAVALIGLSTFLATVGLSPNLNWASPYDRMDPVVSGCSQSAQRVPHQMREIVRGPTGRPVGHVLLIESAACGTIWAKVILRRSAFPSLKDDIVRITMIRPSDNAMAVGSPVIVHDRIGVTWGNMLSATQSCVRAEVVISRSKDERSAGPITSTRCRLES